MPAVKVRLTNRAFDTRGGSRPGAWRPSLSGTQPAANHQTGKAAIMERLIAEGLIHKARETSIDQLGGLLKESLKVTGRHTM